MPGERAASGSVQGAVRACRRQAGKYVQRKHAPAHGASSRARRPCNRAWGG